MRVVLDTNVVVSGTLSPMGPPGQMLDLVLADELVLVVAPRVLGEYREVLIRARFGFDPLQVQRLVDTLEDIGQSVSALPWPSPLTDQSDEIFLATAKAGHAVLVTGNTVDFPAWKRHGVVVYTPRQCLERLR